MCRVTQDSTVGAIWISTATRISIGGLLTPPLLAGVRAGFLQEGSGDRFVFIFR
jgi:hypothetical protein